MFKIFRRKKTGEQDPASGRAPTPIGTHSAHLAADREPARSPEASAVENTAAVVPEPTDTRTLEEQCGIVPGMRKDEIKAQLAKMFRRYNRLASSLDGEARADAERMLDAIVQMREKHLD